MAPCLNEEAGLEEFVARVERACEGAGTFEIVLVNDGSRDSTWALMQRLAGTHPALVCVNLSRNHGHQLALTAGLTVCRGRRVLIIDADLQDPPELLAAMLALQAQAGADVVYGKRRARRGETRWKLWTASGFYRVIARLTDVPIPADTGDFRLITRRALRVLLAMPERRRFIRGMVSWIGFTQVPFEYEREARFAGRTSFSTRRMARFALDALTSFSTRPLRMSAYAGLAGLLAAAVFGAGALWSGAQGQTATLPALAGVVLFVGSVQLIALGVIGEYLGRLYEQSLQRPLFVVERIVRGEQGAGIPDLPSIQTRPAPLRFGPVTAPEPAAPMGEGEGRALPHRRDSA